MARVRVLDARRPDPLQALKVGGIVFVVLFALYVINASYFQVESEEQGVVTTFGRFDRLEGPGLHFKWPIAESVEKVPILKVQKMEFGFDTEKTGPRGELRGSQLAEESLMLTGDLGAAEVEWIVQYKIRDAKKYLFNVRDPRDTLRDLSESVMRAVVGDRSVYEVLTVGRDEIKLEVESKLQSELDRYETGIRVELVQLQTVGPPDARVKAAFNEVNQSEQEKQRTVNEAKAEYNEKIPRARGEAEREVAFAEGFKIERVNKARGEVARFLALLEEYGTSREVTRRRLYLETMAEVLPVLGPKIIVDQAVEGTLPLLHLGPEGGR